MNFFNPGSSAVDWCETNYKVSPFIAEFFNTITNILFFIIPPLMGFLFKSYSKLITKGIHIIWFMLVIVGLGSVYFHATLTMAGQLMDELSILWVLMTGYTVLFPDKLLPDYFHKKRWQWYTLFGLATILITFLCFLNPYLNAYLLMMLGLPIMTVMIHMLKMAPLALRRLGKRTIFIWFLAVVFWVSDRVFCNIWQYLKMPYFHSIFHILIYLASHMSIVIYAYFMADARAPHLKPIIAYYPNFVKNELFALPYVNFKYFKSADKYEKIITGYEK